MIDEKKLIEDIKSKYCDLDFMDDGVIQEFIDVINEQPQSVCSRREWYQKGYQDGLNADKWIPCEVKDIIDTIISHNEIVALWVEEETEDVRYDKQIWRGMAWDIPNSLKGCRFIKIFGTVPESIAEADTINIRIETPKPYKKEGAEC